MKNLYKLCAILAGFIFGISITWSWLQFSHYSVTKATLNDVALLWRAHKSFTAFVIPKAKSSNDLKVSLDKVVATSEDEKFVRLRVENMRREAVYFSGYSIESPCISVTRSNNREQKESCECGNGLGRQILLSGESTVFTVRYLKNIEKAEFGFSFWVNDELAKLYWSETVSLSD
jgi:hypothetical protein